MTEKKNPGPGIAFTMPALLTIIIFALTAVFAAGGWVMSSNSTGMIVERHEGEIEVLEDTLHRIDLRLTGIEVSVEKIENIVERGARDNE